MNKVEKIKSLYGECIIDKFNILAYASSMDVINNLGKLYNPFFVCSEIGLGKTYLLCNMERIIRMKYSDMNVLYTTIEKMTDEIIEEIAHRNGNNMNSLLEKYLKNDVLIIDDIQMIENRIQTTSFLIKIIDEFICRGKQVIISGNNIQQIENIDKHLMSRICNGITVSINIPNYKTVLDIFEILCIKNDIELDDEVKLYLESYLMPDLRKIKGMINLLSYINEYYNRRITLDIIKREFSSIFIQNKSISGRSIIAAVVNYYCIEIDDLIYSKEYSKSREIVLFLLYIFNCCTFDYLIVQISKGVTRKKIDKIFKGDYLDGEKENIKTDIVNIKRSITLRLADYLKE